MLKKIYEELEEKKQGPKQVKVKEENDVYDRLDEIIGKINEKDIGQTH